ncbi:hypothetical protein BVC80_1689g20 [Macleaya cordata]|uniref:Zinc finger protein n=1 Tax=Macleaya cordata TaxID=56857 RepID=A0A200RAX5_MACCD|nr:hypothetical protein BVC80_1689g20 [Macleaya cordata]
MGGGEGSSKAKTVESSEETASPSFSMDRFNHGRDRCQMCDRIGHIGIVCPWVYTRRPFCNGIRKLLISTKPNSIGTRFMTCERIGCNYFQWFDDALNSIRSWTHRSGCFGCGVADHWIDACPWNNTPCSSKGCDGKRKLSLSTTEHITIEFLI